MIPASLWTPSTTSPALSCLPAPSSRPMSTSFLGCWRIFTSPWHFWCLVWLELLKVQVCLFIENILSYIPNFQCSVWLLVMVVFQNVVLTGKAGHTSQIQKLKKTNWTKRVVYYILSGTPKEVVIHFWSNHRGQVFWENQFFLFWGAPKNFFDL